MVALGLGSAMKRNAHERLSAWGGERTSKCHEAGCRARRDRRSKHNRNLKDSQNGRVRCREIRCVAGSVALCHQMPKGVGHTSQ